MAAVATLRLDENRLTTTEQRILGGIITKMPDLYRAITFRLIQQRFFLPDLIPSVNALA